MSFRAYFKGRPYAGVLGGVAVAGVVVLTLNRSIQSPIAMSLTPAQAPPKAAFPSVGPSFLRLKLHSSEDISPTTKRLRFELPSPDVVSGLGLSCKLAAMFLARGLGDWTIAPVEMKS